MENFLIHLSISNIFTSIILITVINSFIFAYQYKSFSLYVDGLNLCSIASVLMICTSLIFAFQEFFDPRYKIIGNFFYLTFLYVWYYAIHKITKRTFHPTKRIIYALITAFSVFIFTFIYDSQDFRILILTSYFISYYVSFFIFLNNNIKKSWVIIFKTILFITITVVAVQFLLSFNRIISPYDNTEIYNLFLKIYTVTLIFSNALFPIFFFLLVIDSLTLKLFNLSHTDQLTKIPNRRSLVEFYYKNKDCNFTLFLIDIDHFKKVNDTHGHDVGDQTLIFFAERLQSILQPNEFAGRIGGEEFVVIKFTTEKDEVIEIAKRLNLLTRHRRINIPPFTCSIGISTHDRSMAVEETLKNADLALYRAKANGRNRFEHELAS